MQLDELTPTEQLEDLGFIGTNKDEPLPLYDEYEYTYGDDQSSIRIGHNTINGQGQIFYKTADMKHYELLKAKTFKTFEDLLDFMEVRTGNL